MTSMDLAAGFRALPSLVTPTLVVMKVFWNSP
jgi:hypothetical protein